MLKQTLKLIWNQRRKYMGIFVEQMLVFLVLLICFISFSDDLKLYLSPGSLDTENTYGIGWRSDENKVEDRENKTNAFLKKTKELSSVIAISFTSDILPYQNGGQFQRKDSLLINGRKMQVYIKMSDKAGFDVYKPKLEEGTWLTDQKLDDGSYPAVISGQLVEKAGWHDALGKQIQFESFLVTVVGVISGMKYLPLEHSPSVMIVPFALASDRQEITVRIKPGEEDVFISDIYKEFRKIFPDKNSELLIEKLDQWKMSHMFDFAFMLSLQLIPTFFLLIFAFIGTFGIFWQYARKRRKEYALRIALGSTRNGLIRFVIREGFIITFLSTLPGILLFFLVYELNIVHFIILGFTLFIMFLFSLTSVWIPAYQVSRVNPAETLHYE